MEFQQISLKILKSKSLIGLVLGVFLIKIAMSLVFINFPGNIFFADITRSTLINMLNQTRYSMGIQKLAENNLLDYAAQLKAQDMIQNGYFNHISPNGVTPWHWFLKAGYNYKYAGENLAIGFNDSEGVFRAWMDSSSHKENMLSSTYTEVGTAVVSGFGENNAIVVVQLFGAPKSAIVATPVVEQTPILEEENNNIENTETSEVKPETQQLADAKGSDVTKQVLASTDFIEIDTKTGVNNFYYRFLNFIIFSQEIFLQYIIYGLLTMIILMTGYILTFNFNKQVNNGLVLRSLILIFILTTSLLINKDLIISALPSQIII